MTHNPQVQTFEEARISAKIIQSTRNFRRMHSPIELDSRPVAGSF